MLPVIPPQTEVLVQPIRKPLSTGGIYLYRKQGCLVVHRLITKDSANRLLTFKGDHPEAKSELISSPDVLGLVVFDPIERIRTLLQTDRVGQPHAFLQTIEQHNKTLIEAYHEITRAFEAERIRYAPIKGCRMLVKSQSFAKNRLTSDLDILVHGSDLKEAAKLVSKLDFRQDPAKEWFRSQKPKAGSHHLPPFRKNGISVELHYAPFPGASEELIRSMLTGGSPEDHYLIQLFHFVRHLGRGDYREKWLRDIVHPEPGFSFQKLWKQPDLVGHHLAPDAQRLLMEIENWRSAESDESDLFAARLHHFILQAFNAKQNTVLPHVSFMTIFPHPRYLRFVYPAQGHWPVILLYPLRWLKLFICLWSMTRRLIVF